MTTEQIAALKVGDTIWRIGVKRRSYRDPGAIDSFPAEAHVIARITAMKFGLDGETTGFRGPKKQRLRDMSELTEFYLSEQDADRIRDMRFIAREADDRYRALVRAAMTEADYQAILDALNAVVLPSKESTDV